MDTGSPSSLSELNLGGEDEEEEMATVSLSEVLATRNKFLEEEELWALCRECCLTLEYVHDCHDLFQSLCISPDTVAFDPEGNVCFLDLDMEPEAHYVAPENAQYGENSYKSHLFSLGMTLLFATEYNTGSDDPRGELSDTFTDLLRTLTSDDSEHRPDLDTVIDVCDKALGTGSSQEICLKIVGFQIVGSVSRTGKSESGIQQMTNDLTAYLQSQSGLVQGRSSELIETSDRHSNNSKTNGLSCGKNPAKDFNDNCLNKTAGGYEISKRNFILKDASFDEEDMSEDQDDTITPRRSRKRQGILLVDLLSSLDRFLDESELWSLCRESILALQRKKKHLPAYISLDTLMVRDSGTICFKAIPEEKPLEVIYMAPELQQKGILNDKTCLYGLGMTLRSAAGIKYSSSFHIPDGEALEILVRSFSHGNPDKRPNLDTAFEMCEEYEKACEIKSRQVCLRMYNDALTRATASASEPQSLSMAEPPISDGSIKGQDAANDNDTLYISSDTTHSLAQGDTTEAEDNVDDIPYDDDQDDTVTPASSSTSKQGSGFKPVSARGSAENSEASFSSSAFKPVAVKSKSAKDPYRVPSAFSSPATHFKPIIIHDANSKHLDRKQQIDEKSGNATANVETDVVAKLKEIKHNLLKHKVPEPTGKNGAQIEPSDNTQVKSKSPKASSDLPLQQVQSQDQLSNTDVLASAIAQYLKNHLPEIVQESTGVHSSKIGLGNAISVSACTTHSAVPILNAAPPTFSHHMTISQPMTGQIFPAPQFNREATTSSSAIMSTHSVPYSQPNYVVSSRENENKYNNDPSTANSSFEQSVPNLKTVAPVQNSNLFPPPPTSGTLSNAGYYSVPYSGMSSSNVPVQFTFVQDPTTGLMQMVPVPLVPMSQTHTLQGIPVMTPYTPGMGIHIQQSTGAQLYNTDQTFPKRASHYSLNQSMTAPGKATGFDTHTNSSVSKTPEMVASSPQQHQASRGQTSGHQQDRAEGSHSQSSSPSPSKDSGICLTQQPSNLPYNKETLMERLLSSENSHRQRTLSQVVRILREEFAEDGFFDIGVEDLAIGEYIISLSSLTWETFRSAVTEKYFHLVWTYDLLAVLYETIGGSKPTQHKYTAKTPPATRSKPFLNRAIDKVDRKRRQSEPDIENFDHTLSRQPPSNQQSLTTGDHNAPARSRTNGADHATVARPKSEIGRKQGVWSETSDSTDTEARDKRRRFRKRCELDKTKSSSMHNITANAYGSMPEREQRVPSEYNQKVNHVDPLNPSRPNPSVFSKEYYKAKLSSNAMTQKLQQLNSQNQNQTRHEAQIQSTNLQFDKTNHRYSHGINFECNRPISQYTDKHEQYKSSAATGASHPSSRSGSSQELTVHNTSGYPDLRSDQRSQALQQSYPPSRKTPNGQALKPPYAQSAYYPQSHMLVNREYAESSSSNSPKEQRSLSNYPIKQQQPNAAYDVSRPDLSYPKPEPPEITSKRPYSETGRHHQDVGGPVKTYGQRKQISAIPVLRNDNSIGADHDSSIDADYSSSAEMRKLAAQKPELYHDRRTMCGSSMSMDKSVRAKQGDFHLSMNGLSMEKSPAYELNQQVTRHHENHRIRSSPSGGSHGSHSDTAETGPRLNESRGSLSPPRQSYIDSNRLSSPSSYEHSRQISSNRGGNSKSSAQYSRSQSAVFARSPNLPEAGIKVFDRIDSGPSTGLQRRGSDSSIQLPDMNHALLPFTKKGHVVYHSAMIQLSLTAEVDSFIHSIDEENKTAIERRLASIRQEITVQRRQRRKTQTFYRKLNDQTTAGKNSKGDQNVSEQILKDMAEMTKKLAFLHLCETHLQMLLAELYGLDSCFLYSLSANEGSPNLNLQPLVENPYLQFRTISTPQAGQMSVLQAGTPRGLMSYLYTSSALSDGYIHQFMFCFRYILTAEQLLAFIIDKCHSAQSSNLREVNNIRIQHRSVDLLHFWLEGFYSVDFASNKKLTKKLADFLKELTDTNAEGADNLFSLYAACRMGENTELMLMTEMDEDENDDGTYFLHLANPKRWESFRSLLKRSKSDKSLQDSSGTHGKFKAESGDTSVTGTRKSSSQFSVSECPTHTLAEQLTLLEQEYFRKCHPIHFLNTQSQGVGVALSMPGLRTPSMSRKSEASQSGKKGLFVGEPVIESYIVQMISHAQELAHWVSAEILSCGSNKTQQNVITKFLHVAHMCLDVRNYASALAIMDGLENLVVRQLAVWKNIPAKSMTYMDELTDAKMKLKSEPLWLMSEKDCHIYPTIPCALFAALHLQQAEIGSFTLANGMFKWDKMRSISEIVDQLRIFRDHEYGFQPDLEIQRSLQRRLNEYSEQDLHAVASTQDNNFRRHSSSSSLTGTLKKVKDKLHSKKK